MLFKTSDITAKIQEQQDNNIAPAVSYAVGVDEHAGYVKYGFNSRKTFFYFSFYKAFDLEAFKANVHNASILADQLALLINFYVPDPKLLTVVTTPKRSHTDKLGYNFASEILYRVKEKTGIIFLEDVFTARNKNKLEPEFTQNKIIGTKNVFLFDDILTTGKTVFTCLDLIRSNPENACSSMNVPVIVGINNN